MQSVIDFDTLDLIPPRPPAQEPCPEALQEEETLAAIRDLLWVPKPEGEEEEAPAEEEDEAAKEAKLPPRYTKLGSTEERPKGKEGEASSAKFSEEVDKIQEKQKAALEELVAKYFGELGDREITRKQGAPACTADTYIPDSVEDFNEKNAGRLAELRANAMESQRNKIRYLRSVVARISTAMGKVPGEPVLRCGVLGG